MTPTPQPLTAEEEAMLRAECQSNYRWAKFGASRVATLLATLDHARAANAAMREALANYVARYPVLGRPVGAPGSVARQQQEDDRRMEEAAKASLAGGEGSMTLDLDYYAGLAVDARKYCLQYSHLVKATEGNASQAHVRLTADELSALVEMARRQEWLAGWRACQEAAASAIDRAAQDKGRQQCCGRGVPASHRQYEECCGCPDLLLTDVEAGDAIRALEPPKVLP